MINKYLYPRSLLSSNGERNLFSTDSFTHRKTEADAIIGNAGRCLDFHLFTDTYFLLTHSVKGRDTGCIIWDIYFTDIATKVMALFEKNKGDPDVFRRRMYEKGFQPSRISQDVGDLLLIPAGSFCILTFQESCIGFTSFFISAEHLVASVFTDRTCLKTGVDSKSALFHKLFSSL